MFGDWVLQLQFAVLHYFCILQHMQTDIFLRYKEKTLIIDTKYYGKTMQKQYDSYTLHSNNLYQIFTYVKNKDAQFGEKPHEVSGMLLYARTDETLQPNNTYWMNGNRIVVQTLNLDCEFSEISKQLNEIAETFFG